MKQHQVSTAKDQCQGNLGAASAFTVRQESKQLPKQEAAPWGSRHSQVLGLGKEILVPLYEAFSVLDVELQVPVIPKVS